MIENKYLEIIDKHQQKIPVKITDIANDFGIKVYKSTMSGISGAILKEDKEYVIYINSEDGRNRQRFTIAHEIAHYVLHKDKIGNNLTDNAMYCSRLSNVLEKQANRLAYEILMPVKFVMEYINENKNISQMASLFEVSEEAVKIRLEDGGNIFLEEKNFKLINFAKLIINYCLDNNYLDGMSNDLKMQKIHYLLYIMDGKYLKKNNSLLFDELPVCMYANPVFITLENEYRSGNISFNEKYENVHSIEDEEINTLIKEVLNYYGKISGSAIVGFHKNSYFWFAQGNEINTVPIEVIRSDF